MPITSEKTSQVVAIVFFLIAIQCCLEIAQAQVETCGYNDELVRIECEDFSCNYTEDFSATKIFQGGINFRDPGQRMKVDNLGTRAVANYKRACTPFNCASRRNIRLQVFEIAPDGTVTDVQRISNPITLGQTDPEFGFWFDLSARSSDTIVTSEFGFFGSVYSNLYIYKRAEGASTFSLFQTIELINSNQERIQDVSVSQDGDTVVVSSRNWPGMMTFQFDGTSYVTKNTVSVTPRWTICNLDCSEVIAYFDEDDVRLYYDILGFTGAHITFDTGFPVGSCFTVGANDDDLRNKDLDINRFLFGCPGASSNTGATRVFTITRSGSGVPIAVNTEQFFTLPEVVSCAGQPDFHTFQLVEEFGRAVDLGKQSPTFLYIGSPRNDICFDGTSHTTGYIATYEYVGGITPWSRTTNEPYSFDQTRCSGSTCQVGLYGADIAAANTNGLVLGLDRNTNGQGTLNPDPIYFYQRESELTNTTSITDKGTLCREETVCGNFSVCNGVNTTCPASEPFNSSVVCREAQGPCEIDVTCTGDNTTCPAREFRNSTYECRPQTNCSAAAFCTFGNETCPESEPLGSDVIIHFSQGPCELQVNCSANSTDVPPREFRNSSYVCDVGGNCTANSTCSFGNETCPALGPAGDDVVIHEPQGDCEKQVNCSGDSTAIPPREFFNSSYVCRPVVNCTAEETCRFGNETCPESSGDPAGSDAIVHEPQGPCEMQVNCTANSTVVPPREFFNASYVCRLGENCTANATCTFGNETCPAGDPAGETVVVHEPQGPCEKQVTCSANSTVVPPREFFNETYMCRNASGCAAAAFCSYGNATCPLSEPAGNDTIIHEPQGPCEKQVNCTANSTAIPPREFFGADYVCEFAGNCSANATCTFGNETCPVQEPIGNDTIIHEQQGPCEMQVNCSANSTVVPPREFFGADYVCELGGNCTANATCTFGNETCPAQGPAGNDTIIHEPQGPCEMQVNCSANSTAIPSREFFGADYVCRLAENCTANATCSLGNETCPNGGPVGETVVVHEPQGPCEKQVTCSANSTAIPPREFFNGTYMCRNESGCSAAAFCTFGNATCPPSDPIGNDTIIHVPQGPCEEQVNCSANSTVIPPREFFGNNFVCELGGNCTANSTCTFGNETCPAPGPIGDDVIIHEPQGPCERQVNCSANSTVVPSRQFYGSNFVCELGGNCTANSTCTFGNETCPSAGPAGDDIVIHIPQGPCEKPVNCSNNSTVIPPREFFGPSEQCAGNANACQAAAFCIFGNATCPPSATADNTTLCQNATACNTAGFCNETTGNCDFDIFGPSVVCRNATLGCEGTATCPGGTNFTCPPNPILPSGTVCDSGAIVVSGSCTTSGGVCNGISRICPNTTIVPDGTTCIPGVDLGFQYPILECFDEGTCESGVCVGGGVSISGTFCNPGGYLCADGVCDEFGVCVTTGISRCTSDDIFVN